MKLYVTRLSHFSRKVRILLDGYGVDYELVDIGNVAEGSLEKFGGNPLCRVPVLKIEGRMLLDSDVIAAFVVERLDPLDRFRVLHCTVDELNIRSVLNGIMSEEVTFLIAKRKGVPVERFVFFDECWDVMRDGLAWLEQRSNLFRPQEAGYLEFGLVCLWEHLRHYDLMSLDQEYPSLRSVVEQVADLPYVKNSRPLKVEG